MLVGEAQSGLHDRVLSIELPSSASSLVPRLIVIVVFCRGSPASGKIL